MYPREAIDFERHPMPRATQARIRERVGGFSGCAAARKDVQVSRLAGRIPQRQAGADEGVDAMHTVPRSSAGKSGPHIHQALPATTE